MKVIYAPETTDVKGKKVLFLAGPIRCARNWQQSVINYFQTRNKTGFQDLIIANPHRRTGMVAANDFSNEMFDSQLKWEMFHLSRAAKKGIVSVFLANQLDMDPFQSYARTTRFELGEWFGELKNRNDVQLVIGWEGKFPGLKYIQQRVQFFQEMHPEKAHQIVMCEEGLDGFTKGLIATLNKM